MKRSTIALLFIIGIACNSPSSDPIVKSAYPNIIILLSDDQGWGDLSSSGNTNLSTPNIDGLGKDGIRFDRFFVNAVCSPTRAELLTGRHHARMGITGTSAGKELLDPSETTIAEIFADAGYATGAFGKWHNGSQAPHHPNARGFQEYYGFTSGHWGNYYSPPLDHNGEIVKGDGFVVDDFTTKAMDFISDNQDKPFLVYLPYNTPHSPMQVPDRWWDKFADLDLEMRHREPESEDIEHTKAALAMVENIDWNVGRLMDHLDDLELAENTIVIYFSDNGPNGNRWNDGMKGRKGSVDEGGLRSPFMIRWPLKLEAGRTVDQIASTLDLLPTLSELAGVDATKTKALDGVSLADLLLNASTEWEDRNILTYWRDKTSVRSQRFRLGPDNQLFDMQADPGQVKNVASEHPGVHESMVQEKNAFERDVVSLLAEKEIRFPLGHPDFPHTYLPARDGVASDGIIRSNRYPNDSYFTNWTSLDDEITWDINVLEAGRFEVELYYTLAEKDKGAVVELRSGESSLVASIDEAHDPPVKGADEDRTPRQESYVKDFKAMSLGTMSLSKGEQKLQLKATKITGDLAPEIRLLSFRKLVP